MALIDGRGSDGWTGDGDDSPIHRTAPAPGAGTDRFLVRSGRDAGGQRHRPGGTRHVLAWREAMAAVGIEVAVWSIHRRIGMSGGLMANAILRETGHVLSTEEASRLLRLHAEAYARLAGQVRPLPGARELVS